MKIIKKIWSIISKVLIAVLIFFMGFILVMKMRGENPSIFGLNIYYIATPSMEPTLEVGDIIVSKNVKDYSKLKVDDVITYKGEVGSYSGKLITHQIIDIKENNGVYTFITKGTKEGATVDPEVREDQVVSKMLFEVPLLGKIVTLMNNKVVFFFVIIVPFAVMLFFECINVVKICKKEEVDSNEEQN